jgi:hypothetical protein
MSFAVMPAVLLSSVGFKATTEQTIQDWLNTLFSFLIDAVIGVIQSQLLALFLFPGAFARQGLAAFLF